MDCTQTKRFMWMSGLMSDTRKVKKWPSDDNLIVARHAISPLVEAAKFAYKLERRNRDKDIPYCGYDIGEREKANCLLPDELLTSEQLRYSEDEQNREALEEILCIAFQLGIEQGRRMTKQSNKISVSSLRYAMKVFEDSLSYLEGK